jgi:tripartite-type tricarboxylate transporter receptor subunit TctC
VNRISCLAVMLAVAAGAIAAPALAQPYPSKAVRVIVPFPAGGATDIITRVVAQKLQESLGQPFVVDNRVGANGNIGTEAAARAPADGYTLVLGNNPSITINPHLYAKLPFDPLRDLAPVATMAVTTQILMVNASVVPAKTVGELIAWVKAQPPGSVNYASAGSGSTSHLAAEMLAGSGAVSMVHIPYRGGVQAIQDVVSGQVGIMIAAAPPVIPLYRTGRVRALATTGARRSAMTPDLPTIAESGFPGFDVDVWFGLLAPSGTPSAIVERLNAEVTRIVALAETRAALLKQGAEPLAMSAAEFGRFLREDHAKWGRIVKASGAKLD